MDLATEISHQLKAPDKTLEAVYSWWPKDNEP